MSLSGARIVGPSTAVRTKVRVGRSIAVRQAMSRRSRTRFLQSLALLAAAPLAGCGASVRPEFLPDGAIVDDGATASADGGSSVATPPRCRGPQDRTLFFGRPCAVEGEVQCGADVCSNITCRRVTVVDDAGVALPDRVLRWTGLICNGPLPPPELSA
jgi:hypothetical protein